MHHIPVRSVLLIATAVLGCGSRPANSDAAVADSASAVLAVADDTTAERRVRPLLNHLRAAMDSIMVAVRAAEGRAEADSIVLDWRRRLSSSTAEHVRQFNDSSFQIAIWPDGSLGYVNRRHLRRIGAALPDSMITASRAESLVATLRDGGVWVWRAEGDTYLELREGWLLRAVSTHIGDGLRAYLQLAADEQERPTAADASVLISWDELGERLGRADRLASADSAADYAKDVAQMRDRYLRLFLGGSDNTPAFDRDGRQLRPEVLASLKAFAGTAGDGLARQTVRDYLRLLEQNGFRRTVAVAEYLRRFH